MTGKLDFKEALTQRLAIIRPTLNQMRDLIRTRPPKLTPGIRCVKKINLPSNLSNLLSVLFDVLKNFIFVILFALTRALYFPGI